MVESIVSAVVAVVTGGAVLTSRIQSRILELDKRVDCIELNMVRDFVSKDDFAKALERVEGHMVRIEDKLDALADSRFK
jgi:pyrimidine operon attenuation protein/uracil phosphoribosyltransferase|tara:strand:- start:1384 stop:1620 length:237 start_codon:yes stop_codon:yes gene_type:complete